MIRISLNYYDLVDKVKSKCQLLASPTEKVVDNKLLWKETVFEESRSLPYKQSLYISELPIWMELFTVDYRESTKTGKTVYITKRTGYLKMLFVNSLHWECNFVCLSFSKSETIQE